MEKIKYEVPKIEDIDSRLLFKGVDIGGEVSEGPKIEIDPGDSW